MRGRDERATRSGQRPGFQPPARWQPGCNVKRPACRRCDGLPERVEATAPLPMFNSLAAAVRQRPELVSFRSSRRMKIAKRFNRSAGWTRWVKESGMPSCFSEPPPLI